MESKKSSRVRFDTRAISPKHFPGYPYVGSVLGRSSIQYTALVPTTNYKEAIDFVVEAWPDAEILAVEIGASAFRANDVRMVGYTYGLVEREPVDQGHLGLLARVWAWITRHTPHTEDIETASCRYSALPSRVET